MRWELSGPDCKVPLVSLALSRNTLVMQEPCVNVRPQDQVLVLFASWQRLSRKCTLTPNDRASQMLRHTMHDQCRLLLLPWDQSLVMLLRAAASTQLAELELLACLAGADVDGGPAWGVGEAHG